MMSQIGFFDCLGNKRTIRVC